MTDTPKPKPPPGRKAAPKPKPLPEVEEKSDRQIQDEYVAGRLDIWKTAVAALRAADVATDPEHVFALAEFLAGDHV